MRHLLEGWLGDSWQAAKHPFSINAGLLTAAQYITAAMGFLAAIIEARLLGPADYGTAVLIIAYPTFLWSLAAVKSISITTRYIASFQTGGRAEEVRSICKLGYSLDFLAAVLAFGFVSGTAGWVTRGGYDTPQTVGLMVAYAASLPLFSLNGTSIAILSSLGRFCWLAVLQILDKVVTLGLVSGFLLAGYGVPGMIIATALGQAAAGVAMSAAALYVLHQEGLGCWWSASLKHVAPLRRELRSAFGWNYALVTFNGLLEQVPVMLLGYRLGPEEAGFYRLAMSLATIGSYLESSLERVVYPILAARWSAGEREDLKTAVKRWTLQGGVPSGTLVCMLMLLLPALVPWMFGSGYRPVVAGAQIIMIGAAVSAVCFWLHAFYYASGDIALWTKAYGLHAILVMGFAWFCLQQWGFIGLAGLTATGKVLFTVTMVVVLVMPWEKTRENLHFSISR